MEQPFFLPKIETVFDPDRSTYHQALYNEMIYNRLESILADKITFLTDSTLLNDSDVKADQRDQFLALMPLIVASWCKHCPGDLSFFSLSRYRANSFKFFFDVLCNGLHPGKRLNLVLLYAADFRIPDISSEIFTFCEVIFRVESQQELDVAQSNFPNIENELKLGIPSQYHARRILEIRGLLNEEKTVVIQEYLLSFIKRLPDRFDEGLLNEMQHFLVVCHETFKANRSCEHLSRIICAQYLFLKVLREATKHSPKKRSLCLKIFRVRLQRRHVLGILVGMNSLQDKETFDQDHLLKAIQNYLPKAHIVEGSVMMNRHSSERLSILYVEIEKSTEVPFTNEEIRLLRQELPIVLKDRVEHLMHPVFMPRNEEEVMRNIVSLSNEIKYLRDIPQVFISFDEQTQTGLLFTIILVRVLKPISISIQEMFKQVHSTLKYIHDGSQCIGTLRRKYEKEATVFRVEIPKGHFLRADHSIDLNKARQAVTSELHDVIGDFRDFNGGMISKQNEVLFELRGLLHDKKYPDLLLENFFYSLTPVVMRTILEPQVLLTLFLRMLASIDKSIERFEVSREEDEKFLFIMIRFDENMVGEEIKKAIAKLDIDALELVNSYVSIRNMVYKGYIYRSDEQEKRELLYQAIQNAGAEGV